MEFQIKVEPNNDGWNVTLKCAQNPAFSVPDRQLTRRNPDGSNPDQGAFALPPGSESSVWTGRVHEPLCEATSYDTIRDVYDRMIIGDPRMGEVEIFGRYLSALLFGDNWTSIENEAKTVKLDETVKLDLYFKEDDFEMLRLPWEMMWGADQPLSAAPDRKVSIARVVASKDHTPVDTLGLPLKVLFVIGGHLDNALRPGAEYLGLLRRLKIEIEGEVQTIDLNARLIREATSDELEAAVNDFAPDVIHFICHGIRESNNSYVILTKREDPADPTSKKTRERDPHDPDRLLQLIRRDSDNYLPQIVLLNACHTADTSGNSAEDESDQKGLYLSFAAKLVAGGVPVVIGMAGEVADGACRIFTRRFYEALIKQEEITLATAQGRRAAMRHYNDYRSSVEWARPIVYIREGISSTMSVDPSKRRTMLDLARITSKYREQKNPTILCDRLHCLEAYQAFHQDAINPQSTRKVLAIGVSVPEADEKFGKTRLLEELAARSILDDFLPCIVATNTSDPPTNLLSLAIRLGDAIDKARENFSMQRRNTSIAVEEACSLLNESITFDPNNLRQYQRDRLRVAGKVKDLGKPGQPPEPDVSFVKGVMLDDLNQLRRDVKENEILQMFLQYANKYPEFKLRAEAVKDYADIDQFLNDVGQNDGVKRAELEQTLQRIKASIKDRILMVLLDDLHRYEGDAKTFLNEVLGDYGLGVQGTLVPVVFTYSTKVTTKSNALSEIEGFLKRREGIVIEVDLKHIDNPVEARLAYGQFLLSLRDPLSVNTRIDKQKSVSNFFSKLETEFRGVPSKLDINSIRILIDYVREEDTLVSANDEMILRNFG